MNAYEFEELRKRSSELEEIINRDEVIEHEIRKVEADFAHDSREDISSISEMQERYTRDVELSTLLEEEHNLIVREEQKYTQFVDCHRESMRKNKTEYEEIEKEIRGIKEREQWEAK